MSLSSEVELVVLNLRGPEGPPGPAGPDGSAAFLPLLNPVVAGHGNRVRVSWYNDGTGAGLVSSTGRGAHLVSNAHVDASAAWVADYPSGSDVYHGPTIFGFNTFDGATVGGAPTFVERLRWDLGDNTWKFDGAATFAGALSVGGAGVDSTSSGYAFGAATNARLTASGTTIYARNRANSAYADIVARGITLTTGPGVAAEALSIQESTDATSARAAMSLGFWQIGQDSNLDGTKDWFLYSGALGAAAMGFTTSGHAYFYGTVAGDDPINSDDFVTKGWGETHLGTAPTSGFFAASRVGGTVDLSAWDRRSVVMVSPGDGSDNNVWEWTGLNVGECAPFRVSTDFGFLMIPPGFYAGTCRLQGNYKAAASAHASLPVNENDALQVTRLPDSGGFQRYEVALIASQYTWRTTALGAGSSQNPDESLEGIGFISKWDADHNFMAAGNGNFVNDGVRKPKFGGAEFTGEADTCGTFVQCFNVVSGEEGLGAPDFPIPYTGALAVQKNGTHHGTFRSFVWRNPGIAWPDLDPPGWYTGPGSKKGQAFVAQLGNFFVLQAATRYGTGGGFSGRVTRLNTDVDMDHTIYSPYGAMMVLGKGGLEGAGSGDYHQIGDNFTEDNIVDWGIPSTVVSRLDKFWANYSCIATDANDENCDFYGFFAARRVTDTSSGIDGYWRPDENKYWFGSVSGGSRQRGLGFEEGLPGFFVGGEHAQDWHQIQGPRIYIEVDANEIFQLRAGQFGWLRLCDAHDYCDFHVSAENNVVKMGYSTDASKFSVSNGNAGTINVDCDGSDLRIRNRTASAVSLYATLVH